MSYETNTEVKRMPVMTVFIGKEIEPDETYSAKQVNQPQRSPQIKNKKEVVHKLIRYFKSV
jgi:hypothetical protein